MERPAVALAAPMLDNSVSSSLLLGHQIGPYTIVSLLGAGGMGEVYRARDRKLGRDVAIKVLPAQFMAERERHARFTREARILATLSHPHIGAIYGLEETDGVTALVLELVEGPTLAERLARGPLPVTQALSIARQIADALDTAHGKGIVHRDLKPANIVLQGSAAVTGSDVRAKVLDFGLAKPLLPEVAADPLNEPSGLLGGTADVCILGTPAYMSPEQARGETVDKRTDVWAFGCVLYEMLTGRAAFKGETISDTLVAVLDHQPEWTALPATTPEVVRRLVRRCLDKNPARRLRDIGDAASEIDDALQQRLQSPALRDSSTLAPSAFTDARPPRYSERRELRWPAILIWAAGLAAVATLIAVGSDRFFTRPPVLQVPVLSRLTFEAGLQTEPSFSPDGRFVAFASNKSGNFDIWIQPVAGGNAVQVTKHSAHDWQPDWSPDGSRILFRSERDSGGLFVVSAFGGAEERLMPFGYRPRWSPDASRILFSTDGTARYSRPCLHLVVYWTGARRDQ